MNKVTNTALTDDIKAKADSKLDEAGKALLSHKEILAHIFKACVPEFKDVPYLELVNGNAMGKPELSKVISENTEGATSHGKRIHYDLKIRAITPIKEVAELIINIEAQKSVNKKYPLLKRAGFYCATMLSEQKGTEFMRTDYGNIKKVYSIWVCTRTPKKRWNTIKEYHTVEKDVVGKGSKEKESNYDLSRIVMIYLGEEGSGTGLLRLLETLFVSSKQPKEKLEILKNEFEIKVTEKIKEDISEMCNISAGIREDALLKGRVEGRIEGRVEERVKSITSLMENAGWTLEQAMKMLGISEEEQSMYKEKLINY